ncbi:MAG: divergent polysaccharide deacetylase family protein [Alphaproteobacteria bacterium]|nr:divergent polysaccharide deacetylase family protein [Alphaproteobacteria bacterium]
MASKPSKPSFIPTPWHAVMWLLLSACLVLLVALWYSGAHDAGVALEKGRRMVITLSTGEIQGRKVSGKVPSPDAEAVLRPDEAVLSSSGGLEAVNPHMLEESEFGKIPTIDPEGNKSWRYYSRPFQHRGGLPMVAVIVGGLGQNKAVAESALRLPPDMTLSFSPYAKELDSWVKSARAVGHEAMLDLPLEPNDYPATDPGPYGILSMQTVEANEKSLERMMASAQAYVGFLAPYNENFSEHNQSFKLLLQKVNNHGLMMVIAREPHKTETRTIMDDSNMPAVVADVWVDEDPSEGGISERLATLEQIAKKRGYAIGIAHGLPITIEHLRTWSAQAAEKGIVLVPVTFIAKPRFS